MITNMTRWLLAGLVCLALWSAHASAQDRTWKSDMDAAVEAYVEGDYAKAQKQFEAAVKTAEAFGLEDSRLATSLNGLAETYRAQGRHAEAEPLHKRALAIREKALGPDNPAVAQSLNNLAQAYRAQGRHTEAQPLIDRAQAIKARGALQRGLWKSYMAAGAAAYQQGRYTEAQKQLEAALRTAEEAFGNQHPRLASSLNNLAELYRTQGRYAEAEPLHKRALAIKEKDLGPDHPSVARSLNNLALVYKAQGRYAVAEPLYKRALAIAEKALGPEHPHVAMDLLENYAALLRETGRTAEANKMVAHAKAIRAKHAR